MTADTSTVVSMLSDAGYRTVAMPMAISNVAFEFPAALIGTGRSQDLIVVMDSSVDAETRIRQKIEALARALDVAQSRRPLTVVLTGRRPSQPLLEALTRVCRVLPTEPLPSGASGQVLRDKLAVLLPLDIVGMAQTIADPHAELGDRVKSLRNKEAVRNLIAASHHGSDRVRETAGQMIAEPLAEINEP
jgi:hypothetical protein